MPCASPTRDAGCQRGSASSPGDLCLGQRLHPARPIHASDAPSHPPDHAGCRCPACRLRSRHPPRPPLGLDPSSPPWSARQRGVHADVFFPPTSSVEEPVIFNPRGFRAYVRNDTFFRAIPLVLKEIPRRASSAQHGGSARSVELGENTRHREKMWNCLTRARTWRWRKSTGEPRSWSPPPSMTAPPIHYWKAWRAAASHRR